MNRLKRIKSTDLNVLRSILNGEAEIDFYQISSNECDDKKVLNGHDNSSNNNDIDCKKKTESESIIIENPYHCRTYLRETTPKEIHENQFLLTRIDSKHKSQIIKSKIAKQNSSNEFYTLNESKLPVYKSIHYKNIVNKEDRLNKKYEELKSVLSEDILMKTVSLCDQSMNDARQLIQNSLAASRIVSSFIKDMDETRYSSSSSVIKHDFTIVPQLTDTIPIISNDLAAFNNQSNSAEGLSTSLCHPDIQNTSANLFGISASNESVFVSSPEQSRKTRTVHQLDNNNPYIGQWMKRKDRQFKLERQLKKEELKIDNAISVGAIAVQERRKAEAEEAFKNWIKTKKPTKKINLETTNDSTDSDSQTMLPQAGRQPAPKGSPIRRTRLLSRPKSCAAFISHKNIKMTVAGHQMSLIDSSDSVRAKPEKHSYNTYRRSPSQKDIPLNRPQTAIPQSRKSTAVDGHILRSRKPKEMKMVKHKRKSVGENRTIHYRSDQTKNGKCEFPNSENVNVGEIDNEIEDAKDCRKTEQLITSKINEIDIRSNAEIELFGGEEVMDMATDLSYAMTGTEFSSSFDEDH